MKKTKEFLNKYKNIILILGNIILIIIFFTYIGFNKENFSLFIKFFIGLYISHKIVFQINEVEKFIINNITYILLLGITYIFYSQKDLSISNKDILLMSGGIIAFWYGYKKYERDKELEIIEKYTKEYNEIIKDISYFIIENSKFIKVFKSSYKNYINKEDVIKINNVTFPNFIINSLNSEIKNHNIDKNTLYLIKKLIEDIKLITNQN